MSIFSMSGISVWIIISSLIWIRLMASTFGYSKWDNHGFMHGHMDVLYSCPLNSLCQCANLPNETYLHEISCHEVSLYKFPGKFIIKYINNKCKVRLTLCVCRYVCLCMCDGCMFCGLIQV